jgi:hypothetical protein
LESNSAACAPIFVTPVQGNVKGITLTTASDAHKHVAAVLKNAEGWQNKAAATKLNSLPYFFILNMKLIHV